MFWKKKEFLDWETYTERKETLDMILWQQRVRTQSLRNLALAEE